MFAGPRIAVYYDSCFWHACPLHGTWPKENATWWKAKLEANRARDRATDEALSRAGWKVVRVWQHENVDEAAIRIAVAVKRQVSRMKKGRSRDGTARS